MICSDPPGKDHEALRRHRTTVASGKADHGGCFPDAAKADFLRDRTTFFDGRMTLASGETLFDAPHRVTAPLPRGLTVVLTLSGSLTCRIDERPRITVRGASTSLILTAAAHRREQVFAAASRIRYLLVHLDPALIGETFGIAFEALVAAGEAVAGAPNPTFLTGPADRTAVGIAASLMARQMEGLALPVHRLGKAFELVALALEQHMPGVTRPRPAGLPPEAERLQAARAILIDECRNPPSLAALAARVGLNERKLNRGFRRLFGLTVHAFLQEHRLQRAHRMLSAGQVSVSEAAYSVGYGPAHFATIFRKRFGLAPSGLR